MLGNIRVWQLTQQARHNSTFASVCMVGINILIKTASTGILIVVNYI